MKCGSLHTEDGGLAVTVRRTETAWERTRGLLGSPAPGRGQGLLIAPCNSVHTMGMSYALDVVFINRLWRVVKVVHVLSPWRFTAALGARFTLEMAGGEADRLGFAAGRLLRWEEVSCKSGQ
ncbi:DUF192 domain-containing protein [Acidithiobacillus sp.]|uniref:DUF192 domain-containing protein n=1 Tax=Acidithiobacillus sp. TaxID=1872118 RepID=UPI003431D77A